MLIQVNSDHIAITTNPAHKELCKSIPEAKWLSIRGQWVYPLSPITARYILDKMDGLEYEKSGDLRELASKLDYRETLTNESLQLNTILWKHQFESVGLAMARTGSILHFEMSCGKSLAAIAIMNQMQANRILIACPLKVMGVWPKQFRIHSKREYKIIRLDKGSAMTKAKELRKHKHREPIVVIVNYDSMWREGLGDEILSTDWDLFAMDELHRIKAYTGTQRRSKFCMKVAMQSKKRIGLTGTLMPHSPLDLWAQMRAIDRNVFGNSFFKYRAKYAVMGGYQGKQILSFQNQKDLSQRLDNVSVYATKKNTLDLPEEIDIDVDIELSQKMRILYNSLEKEMVAWVAETEENIVAKNAMTKLLRLQQLTSGFVRTDEGKDVQIDFAKADWLREMLQDAGQTVVVVCRFIRDLKTVREIAHELKLNYGEVSGARNDLTEDSTIKDETDVLAVQIQAGGEGVDYSTACLLVDYSVGFSLGDWKQMRARLHREGQVNHVTYYHLKAARTVDVKLFQAFHDKQNAVQVVIDGLKEEDVPA